MGLRAREGGGYGGRSHLPEIDVARGGNMIGDCANGGYSGEVAITTKAGASHAQGIDAGKAERWRGCHADGGCSKAAAGRKAHHVYGDSGGGEVPVLPTQS